MRRTIGAAWAMCQRVTVLLAPTTAVASLWLATSLADQVCVIHVLVGCTRVPLPLLPSPPRDGIAAQPAQALRCHCPNVCSATKMWVCLKAHAHRGTFGIPREVARSASHWTSIARRDSSSHTGGWSESALSLVGFGGPWCPKTPYTSYSARCVWALSAKLVALTCATLGPEMALAAAITWAHGRPTTAR